MEETIQLAGQEEKKVTFNTLYRLVEDEYHMLSTGGNGQRVILIDMMGKMDALRPEVETDEEAVVGMILEDWERRYEEMRIPRFRSEQGMLLRLIDTAKSAS